MYSDGWTPVFSRSYDLSLVERIWRDSFAFALLYACAAGREPQQIVEFATAVAIWKHTIPEIGSMKQK